MTTYAQMLEFSDPPDAFIRAHGWGSVRVLMAGSLNANPSFLVRLYGTGKVLWVDQNDMRWAHNPGDERDGIDIPEEWKPGPKRVIHSAVVPEAGHGYAMETRQVSYQPEMIPAPPSAIPINPS